MKLGSKLLIGAVIVGAAIVFVVLYAPKSGTPVVGDTITYTSSGFSPQVLRVKAGTAVKFVNSSTGQIRVASDPHPVHTNLPGFDSVSAVGAGQSYSYTFTKVGQWGYHDHLNPTRRGTVLVK